MEIKSLKDLNIKKNGQYDLYAQVIDGTRSYNVFSFICESKHAMRIDLVCYDIYENTDNIDIISNLNGIINPLTIDTGDKIFFVDEADIDDVRDLQTSFTNLLNSIKSANVGKEYKIDKSRTNDLNKRKQNEEAKNYIPPNIVKATSDTIEYKNGKLILRPNF